MKKYFLLISLIGILYYLPVLACELISSSLFASSNLKAYYQFENDANDSKNSNHGTAANITYSTGKFALGSFYDGATSQITIPNSADFRPSGNFTINMWLKPSRLNVQETTFASAHFNGIYYGILTNILNGKLLLQSFSGNGNTLGVGWNQTTGATTLSTSTWQMATYKYNGINLSVYLNGVLDATTTWALPAGFNATNYVRIGNTNFGGETQWYDGGIDDLGVFNTALSDAEILALYNLCSTTIKNSYIINFDE